MVYFSNAWRRAKCLRGRARLTIAAVAVVGTAAGLLVGAPTAGAHPGQPSAVFDPDETGWASLPDRTVDQFRADVAEWRDKRGYLVVDLEADTFSGTPRFAGVYQRNTDQRRSLVEPMMTEPEYDAKLDAAKRDGLRLVDRELYRWNGTWYVAAAFVENREGLGWSARYGLTLAELTAYAAEQRAARRMPVDFDMWRTADGVRYGLVFLANPENLAWQLHADLTDPQYAATFDAYENDGYRMLSFDSAPRPNGGQRYGGIWLENRNHRTWREWRDMTVHSYANQWHRDADEGYRQIFLGRYETAQGMRHAAIWRQNSDRPTWRYRQDVEDHVEDEMGEDDVPGVAVAVMQGGEFTFLRGFGKADIDEDIDLDADHVLRWASVSKALGGALTMRMHERVGIDFDRDTSVQSYFPDLPDHHSATPEQLASNRGCVRHYANDDKSTLEDINPIQWELEKDEDAKLKSAWFANAQAASYVFHDDPLRAFDGTFVSTTCTPGVAGSSLYSTHGYTLLAAALEGATPHGIKELIQYEIAGPLNLTTLRQEELNDNAPRRAKLYAGEDNDEVEMDGTTWKTLGGGLESTIKDMAKFGRAVIARQVFADTDYVFNGPHGWSYAYGWNLYQQNGHRAAGKSGGQLGSDAHLIVYPDDDTVIAVMINREEFSNAEDHATDIADFIGDTIFGP